MANEFIGNELDAINNSSDIYDALDPIIKKKVKEPNTWHKFLKLVQDFMTKNSSSLQTNIVGKRLFLNANDENAVYDIFGVDKNSIKNIMLNSLYFKETFGRELLLTDQLCLAIPLILAAVEYYRLGKRDESDLCYLFAHFKPYISRESVFFKFNVKEGQMLYTVEKQLSERFDIKKYGTIINVLRKRSQSSYANYIEGISKTEKYTDKKLYVTYVSGIAGSVNSFIGAIYAEYRKCDGKSLDYENAVSGIMDKDSDSIEYSDNDIESDIQVKNQIVQRTVLAITKNPVNKTAVKAAVLFGFGAGCGNSREQLLETTINTIIEKDFEKLQPFFNAIINSFLFHQKPNSQETYDMQDFNSPVFITVGIDLLAGKKPNTKDREMLYARDTLKKMCEDHSDWYSDKGDSMQRQFRNSLAAYWIYLIRLAK